MSINTLIQLPTFSYTSLDFETIIQDVQNLISEHPEYLKNFDNFLETDAGRMLLEMNAFIMEKFTSKLDWVAREMYLSTATQRQSQIDLLQLINYKPTPPQAARVNCDMKLTKWVPSFNLPLSFRIFGPDTTGKNINFECIELASDGKPDYNFIYNVNTGTASNPIVNITGIPFYQGSTIIEDDIWMDGVSNESFTLQQFPIINKSIRIFSLTTGKEFLEVESFISPEAQQQGVPTNLQTIPYMVTYDADNKATVKFGYDSLVVVPNKDEHIQAKYRIGGGLSTNVVANSINLTRNFSIDDVRVTGIFSNVNSGFGGFDAESVADARLTAPLDLRSANKTVTNEDYVLHLKKITLVHHAKIVASENEPIDIFNEYGYFLPPLDTWIYISPVREGIDAINPLNYPKFLALTDTFNDHGWIDYEDFTITAAQQTTYLKKYRSLSYAPFIIVLMDSTGQGIHGTPYVLGVDFTIDFTRSELTRIQTADNGTMPAGTHTFRMIYLKDPDVITFNTACIKTFSSGTIALGFTSHSPIYPAQPIRIFYKFLTTEYSVDKDYVVDYATNLVTMQTSGSLTDGSEVVVQYADNWDKAADCETNTILNGIVNKKMLIVDNHIKQARYGTFDVCLSVYCYKNLRSQVEANLPAFLRSQFTIDLCQFNYPINKAELIALGMNFSGVRWVEVTYLGRNYGAYRKYILGELTLADIQSMDADKVEQKIIPKYNEIITLAWDEFEGIALLENQRHGLMIQFLDE